MRLGKKPLQLWYANYTSIKLVKKKIEKQLPKVSGNTQAKLEHRAESVHSLPPLPLGATAPEVPGNGPSFKT